MFYENLILQIDEVYLTKQFKHLSECEKFNRCDGMATILFKTGAISFDEFQDAIKRISVNRKLSA